MKNRMFLIVNKLVKTLAYLPADNIWYWGLWDFFGFGGVVGAVVVGYCCVRAVVAVVIVECV